MSMSCLWKEPMASASEPPPMQKRSDTWGHGRLEDYLRLFCLAAAWDAAQHTAFFRHPRPSATCWPAPLRSKLRHWLRPSARRLGAEMLPDPVDVAADLASTQQLQQPSLAGCRVQAGVVGPLCFHPQSQNPDLCILHIFNCPACKSSWPSHRGHSSCTGLFPRYART